MLAIYKKELKSYFTSVIACLFIAVTTLISGIFFVYYNLTNGMTQMYPAYECLFILVFTVPILTMKIIADERRQKTDQLILTAPVSVGKIVIGKFFALVTIFAIPVLIMCLYPIILSSFGTMPWKTAYTSLLGLFLYGVALIAIGIFISSITESQVISAILSIVVLLLGYLMSSLTGMISANGNVLTKILSCFDLYTPVQNFMNGVIQLSDVVYYVTLTVLFLFLTCQSIQKRRWNVSKKNVGTGIFSVSFIAIAVALTVFVNLVAGTVTTNTSWASLDMTETSLYSITSDTKSMLKKLDKDITLYVMAAKNSADSTIKQTLSRYSSASKHIKVEYKDTTVYPNFYKEYTDETPTAGSIIVVNQSTKKSKVVDYNDIYVADYSSYYYTGQSSYSSYDCEGQLDSAISYVQSENTYTIYQIEGHDEASSDSQNFGTYENLKETIEKYNCEIETIKLPSVDKITPDECSALLILGPEKDYTEDEAKKVIDYLNSGGKAIIGLENIASQGTDKPNFESILKEFNISVKNGIIAENDTSYYSAQYGPWYAFADGKAGYASDLTSYVFVPYTMGMKVNDEDNTDVTYTALASTTESSVLKTDAANATSYEKEKGDISGPFDVIVSASKTLTSEDDSKEDESTDDSDTDSTAENTKTADILVFGSVYALSDTMDDIVSQSNTQVVNNALKDYIDTEVQTVSVPAKSLSASQLTVTESGSRMFGILISIVAPVLILAAGIIVWVRRRRK
ncbi:MAG: Gldg family protein [Eubacterium sp.]